MPIRAQPIESANEMVGGKKPRLTRVPKYTSSDISSTQEITRLIKNAGVLNIPSAIKRQKARMVSTKNHGNILKIPYCCLR